MIDKVTVEEEGGNGEGSEDQDGDQDTDSKAVMCSGMVLMNKILIQCDTQQDTSSLPQLNDKVKKQLENLLSKEKDLLNGKTPKSKLTNKDARC